MNTVFEKMQQLDRFYSMTSHHLRDLIEKTNDVQELDSVSKAIKNHYNVGNLRDIDFNWLLNEVGKKRWMLLDKED